MAKIDFRLATAADAHVLAELHLASWRVCYGHLLNARYLESRAALDERLAFWRQQLADAGKRIEVGVCAGQVVAMCHADAQADAQGEVFIDNLHVLPAFQGQGLGQRLMVRQLDAIEQQGGCSRVALTVVEGNLPARGFYRAKGGVEAPHGEHRYGDGSVLPLLRVVWDDPAAMRAKVARAAA